MIAENQAERDVLTAMREHAAHGRGEMHLVFTPGFVDIQEGKRTRQKYGLDKKDAHR